MAVGEREAGVDVDEVRVEGEGGEVEEVVRMGGDGDFVRWVEGDWEDGQ